MTQTPIADQIFRHVVPRAGTNIPHAWRRLSDADIVTPACNHFCPARHKLQAIRWDVPALGVFFSEESGEFLREALDSCPEHTRIYLLAHDKDAEAAKKFAVGLAPRLRPLIRTIAQQGPTAICTATKGLAWLTGHKKTWRLILNAEQSAAYYGRFLYAFWHEASSQHHLTGTTWVAQSGSAIEAPFNVPTPADNPLSVLANDDDGLPDVGLSHLVSAILPEHAKASLILTDRSRHSFAKLDALLSPGVMIHENSHDLPSAFIDSNGFAGLIIEQVGANYRLNLSTEQIEDLKRWFIASDSWKFFREIPRTDDLNYLEATFQLENGQETIPGQAFPGGRWEKDLGSFKATDFVDLKDGRLRRQPSELPEPPTFALAAVYTWCVKPPEADKTSRKVKSYAEWDDALKTVSGINKQLISDYVILRRELEAAFKTNPEFIPSEFEAAFANCDKAITELEMVAPEQVGWKHGKAPAEYDPFKTLIRWAEYFEMIVGLPRYSNDHMKWVEETVAAKLAIENDSPKLAELERKIQECDADLAKHDEGNATELQEARKSTARKLKAYKDDLEGSKRSLEQKLKAIEIPAPSPKEPREQRLAHRKDLMCPVLPIPVVGELRITPKIEELTLCIQHEEEIAPGFAEAQRLEKIYAKPIRLAKG